MTDNFDFLENDWFFKKYYDKLGFRFWSFKIALNLFLQSKETLIVETGTIRMPNDVGGGNSTYILGDFCKHYNKRLITIDIDPKNIELSKRETIDFADVTTYITSDSVAYLQRFTQKIGLLYLDSMDCPEESDASNAQQHNLNELKAAWDKLSPNAVVLIDDNNFSNGGKARLSKYFLRDMGWKLVMDFQQTLWVRYNNEQGDKNV